MVPTTTADEMLVHLRAAKPQDWKEIAALLDETWHASYDHILGRLRVNWIVRSLARLEHWLGDPSLGATFPVVVAEVDRRIVGIANAGATHTAGISTLWMLYILPSHQSMGIGKELMENTLSRLPGAARTQVQVLPDNHGAIRFYERNGFRPLNKSFDLSTCTRVLNMERGSAA